MKLPVFLTAAALSLLSIGCMKVSFGSNNAAAPQPTAAPVAANNTATAAPAPQAPAPAPTPVNYFVKTNDGSTLNIRASNSTGAAIVGSAPHGSPVTFHTSDRNGEWFEVTSGNIRGWVSTSFLVGSNGQDVSPAGAAAARQANAIAQQNAARAAAARQANAIAQQEAARSAAAQRLANTIEANERAAAGQRLANTIEANERAAAAERLSNSVRNSQ
ncbi:SH3 domain-containing protein [filamentous cyanobacterium LEGE 11480]|uniref:SH3 domain-containing protein n=1 Tax=Romeriopsis navalis LEGE 11480 TaxID=2777977 RepID=A0A928VKY2_9CYAN|nr:SH3 domain-containing protein [Romeriopsis navalis]MBE9028435.1 SH3 domain-containing protein [Romeriopsis navalis LEGE 11480]